MPTPSGPHQAIASEEPAEHVLDAGYASTAAESRLRGAPHTQIRDIASVCELIAR